MLQDFTVFLWRTRDCFIVAPDYRKSLEAPYPAAVNDGYGAG